MAPEKPYNDFKGFLITDLTKDSNIDPDPRRKVAYIYESKWDKAISEGRISRLVSPPITVRISYFPGGKGGLQRRAKPYELTQLTEILRLAQPPSR